MTDDTNIVRTLSRSARGFSLVEMLVVACVFGILSTLVIAGLERNQTFASTEMSRATVEARFQ
jgi:prepilin-type N-terminal cleavage/methylation domain-containing protein